MTKFETSMRDCDPARDAVEGTAGLRARVLDAAMTETAQEPALPAADMVRMTPEPGRPRSVGRRRILAVVAAIAFAFTGIGYGTTHFAATAEARDVLALAANQATDPPARPDQWWEVRLEGTSTSGYAGTIFLVRERHVHYHAVDGTRPSWYFADQRERVRQLTGPPAEITPSPSTAWTTEVPPNELPGSWQSPTPKWLAALPRDTDALRSRLYQDSQGGSGPDGAAYTYAADLLRSGLAPADLRAALFRVLQTIPGAKVIDRDAVIAGRTAVAIGRTDFGTGRELLFAQDTGEFLGERARAVRGGGTLDLDHVVTRTVVDEVPEWLRREAEICLVDEYGSTVCGG